MIDEEVGGVYLRLPPDPFPGPVPVISPESKSYWEALHEHRLGILRCQNCRYWVHYPLASCRNCHSLDLKLETVSGRGSVYSFTVVHREFAPGIMPPFVAAVIDLDEQPGLRMMTNLVNCYIRDISIGMRVKVVYHDISDQITLPYWEKEATATS